MEVLQASITGLVQGLTEFLPISSSGHLVLTSSIFKLITGKPMTSGGDEEIFFDIMLHVATLIAVFIYFRKDIKHLSGIFIKSLQNKTLKKDKEAQFPIFIGVGTMASVAVAYPLKDFFESLVYNPSAVGLILILTGIVLYSSEILAEKIKNKTNELDLKKSLIIGIFQGLAVAPGLSRSGSTIAAGLACGLDRVKSARYSFLLSVPIIILAALFNAFGMTGIFEVLKFNWTAILAGCLISGISGYYCIKYLLIFLSKYKLNVFAYYCWAVGIFMFFFFSKVH